VVRPSMTTTSKLYSPVIISIRFSFRNNLENNKKAQLSDGFKMFSKIQYIKTRPTVSVKAL
jgi:hypothetical protein